MNSSSEKVNDSDIIALAQDVLELVRFLPKDVYQSNPVAIDMMTRKAQSVLNKLKVE